jgi:hypothetical protein
VDGSFIINLDGETHIDNTNASTNVISNKILSVFHIIGPKIKKSVYRKRWISEEIVSCEKGVSEDSAARQDWRIFTIMTIVAQCQKLVWSSLFLTDWKPLHVM